MHKFEKFSKKEKHKKDLKKSKLLQAYENNLKISSLNLGNKFDDFEQWELNKSNRLLYEINRDIEGKNTYKRFKRGQIVRVDFGVNIGGEFSNPHFALVVSKSDNMYNNILTVIPLTSKNHIGTIIIDENIKLLQEELKNTIKKIDNYRNLSSIEQSEFIPIYEKKLSKIEKIINYYNNQKTNISYAFIEQIRTISKYNIISPINEYDIINNLVCSKKIMSIIDKEIIKKFTGININEYENFVNINLT